jgi:hypothetical protein
MAVLEKVTQMKKRGLSDDQIIQSLRDERVSPKEIRDAMNQSQIKSAVSMNEEMEPSMMEAPSPEQEAPVSPQKESQPQEYTQGSYVPKTKEIQEEEVYAPQQNSQQQDYYAPQTQQQYAPQQQAQYSQQEYQPQEYQEGYAQPYQEAISTDTIIEISQQVFSESMKNIQKKMDEFNEFKTLSQVKVDNALERLKRIEAIIDKLQISILEKIGTYGKSLDDIKKEMSMMQDSFSKIVNPLVDQSEENFSRARKQGKSVEDLFPEEPSEEQAEEQTVPEENFQPKRMRKISKR